MHVKSLTIAMLTMRFLIEIMCIFEVIKSYFKGSYDEPNLTLVDIPNEMYF